VCLLSPRVASEPDGDFAPLSRNGSTDGYRGADRVILLISSPSCKRVATSAPGSRQLQRAVERAIFTGHGIGVARISLLVAADPGASDHRPDYGCRCFRPSRAFTTVLRFSIVCGRKKAESRRRHRLPRQTAAEVNSRVDRRVLARPRIFVPGVRFTVQRWMILSPTSFVPEIRCEPDLISRRPACSRA